VTYTSKETLHKYNVSFEEDLRHCGILKTNFIKNQTLSYAPGYEPSFII
jgi:hypothetical protein